MDVQFIQAKWYTAVTGKRAIDLIVVHCMQSPNKPDTAEGVGRFFQQLPADRKASAHAGCDVNSRCGYVRDNDVAYGAPNANHNGLHLEFPGYAEWLAGNWTQPEMMAALQQGAAQIRQWMHDYNVPGIFRDAAALRKGGARGITTHNEVEMAWPSTGHWDPGPNFPMNTLLAMATARFETIQEEEEAMLPPYFAVNDPIGPGYWLVKRSDGGVFAYGPNGETSGPGVAPSFGALPGKVNLQAPIVHLEPYVVAGVVRGYWLLGADGGVFALGEAPFTDSFAGHPEWHNGNRTFTNLSQRDPGYMLVAYENGTDPPKIDPYDLTVKR